jgi:hypothetical protein
VLRAGLLIAEALRVAILLPRVELGRHRKGPGPLVEELRERGRRGPRRSVPHRIGLRRVIGLIDRILPGEPSCYRRTLLEIGLDAGAAQEPLHMGIRVPGAPRSGHAWLGDSGASPGTTYDVQFDI